MRTHDKLIILADAAKYDASCASSGTTQRHSKGKAGLGSTTGMGICHSYTPDGRCVSLLKILLTNFCMYDCSYCVSRVSSPVKRARFTPEEVVTLTLDFYKRNYIEGLFLSSGIIQSSDYTMEQLVQVARSLREEHNFRGYIHLKTIPEASEELIREAGRYADRLSINIELPQEDSLRLLAPEKSSATIHQSMGKVKNHIDEAKESRKSMQRIQSSSRSSPKRAKFNYSPAGQSTQMIIGADASGDSQILSTSSKLYRTFNMRRVYYSAFSPIPQAGKQLPLAPPPLIREHRLYQADWLLRFYGFEVAEIAHPQHNEGMLDLDIDPKLSWALRNRDFFPVDVNRASKEALLRVPGLGTVGVGRILQSRGFKRLRIKDVKRCGVSLKKVQHFIQTIDHYPKNRVLDSDQLKHILNEKEHSHLTATMPNTQLDLFAAS